MKFFLIIFSFLLFTNCSFTNTKLATKEYGNNIETSSIVTVKPKILKIDGGMVKNNWFSQFLSSVINLNVLRPKVQETTALGAALLAGYSIGVFKKLSDISRIWKIDKKFKPSMSRKNRLKLLNGWNHAIKKTLI